MEIGLEPSPMRISSIHILKDAISICTTLVNANICHTRTLRYKDNFSLGNINIFIESFLQSKEEGLSPRITNQDFCDNDRVGHVYRPWSLMHMFFIFYFLFSGVGVKHY